jgi:hypothetical protein
MDCTGHKLVERMPSATSDSKHRVANLQRGGIDWISFPFPSLMDKCYQPSAQHPSGAWNSAAAKQRSHRFVTGSRPAITFVSGRAKAGQIERSADSRSPFPYGLNVAVPHFCGSDRGGRVLSAANIPTREVEQMGPSFV